MRTKRNLTHPWYKAIQEQLAKLRVRPDNPEDGSDEDEDKAEQDRITRQILAEQQLEERLGAVPRVPDRARQPGSAPTNLHNLGKYLRKNNV